MKRSSFLVALLVLTGLCISCKKSIGDAYVVSASGLYLRAGQSVTSAKLALIPIGSKVTLLEQGTKATIDGITESWYRVEFGGKQGWAFGGYLLKDGSCVCRYTPEMTGSVIYGKCMFPGIDEDLGGGLVPGSDTMAIHRIKAGGRMIVFSEIMVGYKGQYACFLVADKLVLDAGDANRLFYGMDCRAKGLKNTGIIALGDVGADYDVTVRKAWGVDTATGKIREIDPREAECELPCKGDECI